MLYASNWVAGRLLSWRYASAPVSPIERLEGLPAFAGLCTVCTGCRRGRPGQDLAANKDVGAAQCALFFTIPVIYLRSESGVQQATDHIW